jgi:hypothetical protein
MAANKYIALISGKLKEVFGQVTSAGAGDANKIVALDSTGKLDISLMPIGLSPEVVIAPTSENLTAGNIVNLYSNAGVLTLRKADATDNTKPAYGFVAAGTTSPAPATMYVLGVLNSSVSGKVIGTTYYLDTTAGGVTATPPSASNNIVQEIGIATSATELLTNNNPTVQIA